LLSEGHHFTSEKPESEIIALCNKAKTEIPVLRPPFQPIFDIFHTCTRDEHVLSELGSFLLLRKGIVNLHHDGIFPRRPQERKFRPDKVAKCLQLKLLGRHR
jgi:hypothetical protein